MWRFVSCWVLIAFTRAIQSQDIGDNCETESGSLGSCQLLSSCPLALQNLRLGIIPGHCGFSGNEPIICCNMQRNNGVQRSEQKCAENLQIALDNLDGAYLELIGGVQSMAQEFPHMAALGFGDDDNINWLCGGSLISELYVLTAAHCLISREFGAVRWVRLGDLNLNSTQDDALPQDFRALATFKHPEYRQPLKYHDVALILLDRPVEFNSYILPACLYTSSDVTSRYLTATGWGTQENFGESSEHLMKVDLEIFTADECRDVYRTSKTLDRGIHEGTQICAGGRTEIKDTCKGDSGGPLQMLTPHAPNLYYVVGITAFGKVCGNYNTPGVYMRVSHYVPWIESVVWP